jgi:hypothetical protein
VRRLVTILRREAAAGVSAALLHFADACCARGGDTAVEGGIIDREGSVSVPKSADYVITAVSSGDDGDSPLPGSVVVPGSYGRSGIQLGDDYGEELTG